MLDILTAVYLSTLLSGRYCVKSERESLKMTISGSGGSQSL